MVIPLPEDVQAIRQETVGRFGALEWERSVLTNQVHGHLGIYSLIGVKMGLLATELLRADAHHPSVLVHSFAGSVPPLSCLNDGLQISTGSTLGRGLITVEDGNRPEALFTLGEKTVRLCLKPEFDGRIQADIASAAERFGQTPAYWQAVREAALRYWSGWDRHEIFIEL